MLSGFMYKKLAAVLNPHVLSGHLQKKHTIFIRALSI
jgi:hypothetical protein